MGDDPHTLLKVLRALLPMVVSTIPPKGHQITILLAIYLYLDLQSIPPSPLPRWNLR
jgi:hypothetical protein